MPSVQHLDYRMWNYEYHPNNFPYLTLTQAEGVFCGPNVRAIVGQKN